MLRRLLERAAAGAGVPRRAPGRLGRRTAPTAVPVAKEALLRLAGFVTEQDAEDLLAGCGRRFWSARLPPLRGQLQQLGALDAIGDDTRSRRGAAASARLARVAAIGRQRCASATAR